MRGIIDKVKGRLKKVEASITGDRARKAQGAVQEAKGDLELEGAAAVDNVKAGVSRAKAKIKGGIARSGRRPRQP
jgi:uncharacterized protein YjbJ (UPF0337 family)